MFCVECGSEEQLFGSLCRKCLTSKAIINPPSHIELDMCHTCGKFLDHGRWSELDHVDLSAQLLESLTKTHGQIESLHWVIPDFESTKGEHRVICQAIALIGGEEFLQDFGVGIRIRVQMCPSCSRQSADYFEAVIQLRRDGVAVKDAEVELAIENQQILNYADSLAGNEENAFLSKWGPVQGGFDYYLGSMILARNIAARMRDNYGARILESNTLMGQKDGQDLYRYTFLVRLPAQGLGDVVVYEKKLYVVEHISRKTLTIKSIAHGQILRVQSDDLKLKMVAKYSELKEAVVVSHEDNAIQVLDPDTMQTVTVLRPAYMRHVPETVPVFRYDECLHAV